MSSTLRAIAFHLPQFHPIPENDGWWGRGFTEWTNVTKARSLFNGHHQPHLPADLGFYDLRLPEARIAQAELARDYGIHGFCYYHYWFNGRRVLERPVNEILSTGEPDFPFCLCWANENWTRRWDGEDSEVLLAQQYSDADDIAHIRSLIPCLSDHRYIRVDGRPLLMIYRVSKLPDPAGTAARWRHEAERAGLPGLFLVHVESCDESYLDPRTIGFDAALEFQPRWTDFLHTRIPRRKLWHRKRLGTHEPAFINHQVFDYSTVADTAIGKKKREYPIFRSVCPGFDNTARRKKGGVILHGSTPALYENWLTALVKDSKNGHRVSESDGSLVFINAWNEWAEGNHLEPCQKWGRSYLEATHRAMRGASR